MSKELARQLPPILRLLIVLIGLVCVCGASKMFDSLSLVTDCKFFFSFRLQNTIERFITDEIFPNACKMRILGGALMPLFVAAVFVAEVQPQSIRGMYQHSVIMPSFLYK